MNPTFPDLIDGRFITFLKARVEKTRLFAFGKNYQFMSDPRPKGKLEMMG